MASQTKRKLDETDDPDYENVKGQEAKRQRALEEDGRQLASIKVQSIIHKEFQTEISSKEREFHQIDMKLNEARMVLDRLRACIVANYYGLAGRSAQASQHPQGIPGKSEVQSIHPAVKKLIGKAPKNHQSVPPEEGSLQESTNQSFVASTQEEESSSHESEKTMSNHVRERLCGSLSSVPSFQASRSNSPSLTLNTPQNSTFDDRRARLKIKRKIIVGNVSKYIPVDQREPNDMSSHKWMVYVRGPKSEPDISYFIKRVWFFLHHSYKPNDLVEVSNPPFHLTRRGWGEFPVRVQLHFVDPLNKKVDIFHHLKLDKTFTGLQKLGGETVVEVELERNPFEETQAMSEKPTSAVTISRPVSLSSSLSSMSTLPSSQKVKSSPTLALCDGDKKNLSNDSGYSRTSEMLSEVEIKKEVALTLGPPGDKRLTVENSSGEPMASHDIPSSQSTKEARQQEQEPETQIKTELRVECSDKSMSRKDGNVNTKFCISNPSLTSNSDRDAEYHVTISHCGNEKPSSGDDVTIDVCDDSQEPSSFESVENHNPEQSPVCTQVLSRTTNLKPSHAASSISCNIDSSVSNISSQSDINSSTPSSRTSSQSSLSHVLRSVPYITLQECQRNSPRSTSIASLAKSPTSGSLRETQGQNGQQRSLLVSSQASSSSPSLSFLSSSGKLEVLQDGNIPLQTQAMNHQSDKDVKVVTLGPGASPPKLAKTASLLTPASLLKANNLQTVKLMGVAGTQKANPSAAQTLILKQLPKMQAVKMVCSTDAVKNHKIPFLQNEDCVNNQIRLQVQPSKPLAKVVFLKPNVMKSTPHPSVTHPLPLAAKGNKKQVSLLTGLVVDPVKSIHSSNVNSLLRPGTLKVIGGFNSPKAANAGTPSVIMPQNRLPANLSYHKVASSSSTASKVSSVLPANQQILCTKGMSGTDDLSPFHKMSAIGITKHKYCMNLYRQAVAHAKKSAMSDLIEGTVEEIPRLKPDDYQDIRGLMKAAIKLHPLIQADANKLTHPYCAVSREQWASWPTGKQRASEWHRACFILKYLKSCLGGKTQFKGEQLMTTRQLVHWCRLHAFSPQAPIPKKLKDNHPSSVPEDDETNPLADLNTGSELKSATKLQDALSALQNMENSIETHRGLDMEVDIVGEDLSTSTSKHKLKEKSDVDHGQSDVELLPGSEGAAFVGDWMRQRGIKFSPQELEAGVLAQTAADMVFQAMVEFSTDILRKAVCVNAEQGSSSSGISLKDVHGGLTSLPEASFCCNKFLGKEEEEEESKEQQSPSREKSIYR